VTNGFGRVEGANVVVQGSESTRTITVYPRFEDRLTTFVHFPFDSLYCMTVCKIIHSYFSRMFGLDFELVFILIVVLGCFCYCEVRFSMNHV
jgi:hypothetical protein